MSNLRDASPKRENPSVAYVVMKGESYEGGTVQGIFATRAEAREYLIEVATKTTRPNKHTEKTLDCWKTSLSWIEVEKCEVGRPVE
jgi:hypothetical protein